MIKIIFFYITNSNLGELLPTVDMRKWNLIVVIKCYFKRDHIFMYLIYYIVILNNLSKLP